MKKTLVSLITVSLLTATFVSAQRSAPENLNYNYVEGIFAVYPDYNGQDFIGPRVRGSFLVMPEVFLFGQFRFLTDDVDYTQMHVGAAYRFAIDENTDIYGGPSLEYVDFSPGTDDFGFGLRGGIRHRLNEDFEIGGEIRYVNIRGDIDDDYLGVTGTLQYFLNPNVGLVGEVDLEDGELGLLAGVRWNF